MKIKNLFVYLTALFFIVPVMESCKRGDEDPVSLRLRKNRVAGVWKAAKFEVNGVDQLKYNDTISTNVLCGLAPATFQAVEFVETDSTYEYVWDFDRDGRYEYTIKETIDQEISYTYDQPDAPVNCVDSDTELSVDRSISIGEWNLAGGIGTIQKKELLVLTNYDLYGSEVWFIVRLANDEIKLERQFIPNSNVSNEPIIIKLTLVPFTN